MRIMMERKGVKKTVQEVFRDYITYCKAKNLSDATIYYYNECFGVFSKFYDVANCIDKLQQKDIQEYALYLVNNTNNNNTSVNTRLRGLRAFLYYAMRMAYLQTFKIELIKAEKKIKETYTDDELAILLKKPNVKTCNFTEYRDWVIINYVLATGNREATIVNIKNYDVDFENEVIKLQKTKNRKQQIIPITRSLIHVLREYMSYRKGENDDYLFCNIYGSKLTEDALRHSIRKYNRSRGVMKTSLHLFRHTFSKKWITSGGCVFKLQKILGHSSLDMVKEYVNMFSEDLKQDFDRFNPLEQMTNKNDYIKMT